MAPNSSVLVCVPSRYAGILTTHLLQRTNIVFVFAFACWVGLLQIKFEPVHSQTLSQWHQWPPSPLSSCRERNYVRQKIVTDVQCKAFIGSADLAMHLLLSSKHNRHISAEIKKRFLCKSETLCPTSALSHEMSLWNKLFKLNVVPPDFSSMKLWGSFMIFVFFSKPNHILKLPSTRNAPSPLLVSGSKWEGLIAILSLKNIFPWLSLSFKL